LAGWEVLKNTMASPPQLKDHRCKMRIYWRYCSNFFKLDIYGCGEGVDAIGGTYHMVQGMGRGLIGQSPFAIHKWFEQARRGGHFGGGQSGMFVAVLSAIETALWDLTGKALGLPVYQLLGGKFRDKVRVYCDTVFTVPVPSPADLQLLQDAIKTLELQCVEV
jgi:galactonate dehydratase